MVTGINQLITSNSTNHVIGHNNKKTFAQNGNNAVQEQATAHVAVTVDISDEARKKLLVLKEYDEKSPLKLDESFFNQEVRLKSKEEFARKLSQPVEIDPFDNEFQILAVQGVFNDGTLEKFITDSLDGKARNASLVADELGQMIRGAAYNPNSTVEERATNRETALKIAEKISKKYFDNPDEAKAFMDEINRFAENDILREKGYTVLDNSNLAPFRSYTSAIDGNVNWSEYTKKYGKSDLHEIFANPKELESFVKAINKNSEKWNAEIVKDFEDNEKKIADIIEKVKNSLNETDVTNSLQRILKAF